MRVSPALVFAVSAAALSAVVFPAAAQAEEQPVRTAPGLTLPATFTGTLPMASGPGAAWHLDLWPDQTFHLTQRFGPDAAPTADLGRWSVDPARGALVLRGGREAPVFFEIRGNGSLRLMDRDGAPIESTLNYTLEPGPLTPAAPSLPLTGTFRYMADAALFSECLTGRSYPVAMEQDYLSAERSYLALEAQGGAPVFAVLEGQLAMRPAMEGPDQTHLVIERFDRFEPEQACPDTPQDLSLTGGFWRITDLNGVPLPWAEGTSEPFLLLEDGDAPGFSASVGCNRMRGTLTLGDSTLSFGPAAMTMMACPPPLNTAEQDLATALTAAQTWRIEDGALVLSDADASPLVRAEPAYRP